MVIISEDNKKTVDIGRRDILFALYSTADCRLSGKSKKRVEKGLSFLEKGVCSCDEALETARQINLIRDELSSVSPDKMVYDKNDSKKEAPWGKKISPVITSCGNYFTTADGKDLFSSIVELLVYADVAKVSVEMDD